MNSAFSDDRFDRLSLRRQCFLNADLIDDMLPTKVLQMRPLFVIFKLKQLGRFASHFRYFLHPNFTMGERQPSTRVYNSKVSGRQMECRMQNGIASLHDEYYVIEIDGRTKSGHRRFVDALRVALQLRDEFPSHDVKVRAAQTNAQAAELVH